MALGCEVAEATAVMGVVATNDELIIVGVGDEGKMKELFEGVKGIDGIVEPTAEESITEA